MRNIIFLILAISLISCGSQQKKSEIIYFLPFNVKEKISEKLKTINNLDEVSFTLGNDNAGNYIIYLNQPKEDEYKFWINNTNRTVFIDGKLYPIVFETDEYFSYPENKEIVLDKMNKEETLRKIIVIRDNVFNVKFKLGGEIIK